MPSLKQIEANRRNSAKSTEGLTNSSHPAGEREHVLVKQMVYFGWRLRRLMSAETQSWTRTFEYVETLKHYREDTKLADSFKICEQTHLRLQRLIASVQRNLNPKSINHLLPKLALFRQPA